MGNYFVTYNGPTSAGVTFDIAPDAVPGARDIVLTNPDGQMATLPGAFTIDAPVSITSQPQSAVVCTGGSVQLCVTATGSAPVTYQWRNDGSDILGETSNCYSAGAGGSASYTCVVTNGCGSVESNAAVVAVAQCVTIDQAKAFDDGTLVAIIGKPVSATYSDGFYIEEPARYSGIRVTGSAAEGATVDVAGHGADRLEWRTLHRRDADRSPLAEFARKRLVR